MNQPLLIYSDYLPAATVTATDTKAGLDPLDVLQAEEDNVWQPANTSGAKSLTIDLGSAQDVGCVGIVGEYLLGVQIAVAASSDNFAASNVAMGTITPMGSYTTAWLGWGDVSYRYWRLTFTGVGPSFAVAHVALCRMQLYPWFADGADLRAYKSEGSILTAPDGRFLGSNRLRTMREVPLDWGQVTDTEFVWFERWADASIKPMRPFFLVPDTDQEECWFGWLDPRTKFSAPMKHGLRDVGKMTFLARVA